MRGDQCLDDALLMSGQFPDFSSLAIIPLFAFTLPQI